MKRLARQAWHWIAFAGWLPYFIVTLPWQLRRIQRKVLHAIDLDSADDERRKDS